MNNQPKINDDVTHELSLILDDLKEIISLDSIRKAITDAYNTGMVKLFLENFKRNEEK